MTTTAEESDALELPQGVSLNASVLPGFGRVLSHEALAFVADLCRRFEATRRDLLARRQSRQTEWDAGALPNFLAETRDIREADWTIGEIPSDLKKRWVEITGPTERKMMINALNSDADVFMADCEDALSPTWPNVIGGQVNLLDYWNGELAFDDTGSGKSYRVGDRPAVLLVRPRGWHLPERHILIDGEPAAGALVDFGLYVFHNARSALDRGSGPYFYLPKMESHLEARLWNEVFEHAQSVLGLPSGTIKATALIETLPAAFEMDEILYELRDHIVGLNCGRWDYIFSFIKVLRAKPEYMLPDRSEVVMGRAFLKAYSLRLIQTCHRRGAYAMGGMAAQIPNRRDEAANAAAMEAVRADKEREVKQGHDGTWVAHPDLVPVARRVFEELLGADNQLEQLREDAAVGQAELLEVHKGKRSEAGLRTNIRVGVQYIEAWLRGNGAVPLYNLMEDAATAEISRTQIWQWLHHGARLEDGRTIDRPLVQSLMDDEMAALRAEIGEKVFGDGRYEQAIGLFSSLIFMDQLDAFLTVPAYELIGD